MYDSIASSNLPAKRASSPTFTALSNAAFCCGLASAVAGVRLDLEVLCAWIVTTLPNTRASVSENRIVLNKAVKNLLPSHCIDSF